MKAVDFIERRPYGDPKAEPQYLPYLAGMKCADISSDHPLLSSMAVGKPNPATDSIVTKFLSINKLGPGAYFGEGGILAISRRTVLSEQGDHIVKWKRGTSVVTSTKTVCVIMAKSDFLRLVNEKTFEIMQNEARSKAVDAMRILEGYLESERWTSYKELVMNQLFQDNKRHVNRN